MATTYQDAPDVEKIADGVRLANRIVVPVGEDVLLAWDVVPRPGRDPAGADRAG